MTLLRTTVFIETEVVTPKLDDTREDSPEENNSQINPSTETHNEICY